MNHKPITERQKLKVRKYLKNALRRGLSKRRRKYWLRQAAKTIRGTRACIYIMPRPFLQMYNPGRNPPACQTTFILDARV